MRWTIAPVLGFVLTGVVAMPGAAQDLKETRPGVIIDGSSNTLVGGQAAARQGDRTDGGRAVIQGSPDVFINGRPAALQGDKTNCGETVIGGASNVFINGRPVARAGDLTSGCPGK